MSDRVVRVVFKVDESGVVKSFRQIESSSDKAARKLQEDGRKGNKSLDSMAGGAHKVRGAMVGLASLTGLGAVAFGLKDIVQAGLKAQEQQAQLQNALRQTGQGGAANMRMLQDAIDRVSTHGGFDPHENAQALTQLVRATGSASKAQKDLTLSTNISRGTHKDFLAVTKAVAMVEQGRTTGLARLGIVLPKVTKAQDALKASGAKHTPAMLAQAKAADAVATRLGALERLQQLYGGSSAAYSKTAAGAMSNFQHAVTVLTEKLGTLLLPMLTKAAKWLSGVVDVVTKHWPEISKVAKTVFGIVGGAINTVIGVVKDIIGWLQKHKDVAKALAAGLVVLAAGIGGVTLAIKAWAVVQAVINTLMSLNPIGATIIALAVLTGAVVYAYNHFKWFRDTVKDVWGWLKGAANWIGRHWQTALGVLTLPFTPFILILKGAWEILQKIIGGAKWVASHLDALNPFSGAPSPKQQVKHLRSLQLATGGAHPVAQQYIHRASGGYVGGPGSGRDTIPAMLSPGEFVLRPEVVSAVGSSALNSLNATGRFAGENDKREIVIPITLTSGGRVLATETTRYALRMQARR